MLPQRRYGELACAWTIRQFRPGPSLPRAAVSTTRCRLPDPPTVWPVLLELLEPGSVLRWWPGPQPSQQRPDRVWWAPLLMTCAGSEQPRPSRPELRARIAAFASVRKASAATMIHGIGDHDGILERCGVRSLCRGGKSGFSPVGARVHFSDGKSCLLTEPIRRRLRADVGESHGDSSSGLAPEGPAWEMKACQPPSSPRRLLERLGGLLGLGLFTAMHRSFWLEFHGDHLGQHRFFRARRRRQFLDRGSGQV